MQFRAFIEARHDNSHLVTSLRIATKALLSLASFVSHYATLGLFVRAGRRELYDIGKNSESRIFY